MIVISAVLAALSAILGHLSALAVPGWFGFESTSTSGMMAVMTGLIFMTVLLFAPRHGVLTKRFAKKEAAPGLN